MRDGSDHRPRFTIRPAAELTRFTPSVRVLFKAICVVIKVGNILEHSDITLIAVFLLLYASATITFCFLLSSFFSKASNAAAGAGILWFVSYVPSFYVNRSYPSLTLGEKQGYCFILNTCMTLGANIVSQQEGNGVGVTWATVADPISIDDSFRFGSVLMMLLVDAIVYFIMAWYLEGIWPGDFGIPKPWYFPISNLIELCSSSSRKPGRQTGSSSCGRSCTT